jgi:nucleoid DNA-binding protein
MAKAKKTVKKPVTLAGPKGGKRYTATQLVAHLAAKAEAATGAPVARKVIKSVLEELVKVAIAYAPAGAPIPGLGKVVLRKVKARPAREGLNPKTGEKITIPAKPARTKLVFRFAKIAKEAF